tara:strand:+ start:136 stop:243 length:108 start_codon:yes stop_codon:yes gene_type:complete
VEVVQRELDQTTLEDTLLQLMVEVDQKVVIQFFQV